MGMVMLDLPDAERLTLKGHFDTLAQSFAALDDIDTGDTQPLVSVLDLHNIMREDVASKITSRDELLKNSPGGGGGGDGYFHVPAAID